MSLLALPDKVIVPHIFGQLDLHWLLSSKNKVSKRWNQLIDSTMKHLKEQGILMRTQKNPNYFFLDFTTLI